ncbi:hypothetical protein [Burkholderia ubonensis]|uniref:hypothetical protein n=1 Tax=Burkholderia ubonensis TaxID=101571 RepID=UPI00075B9471|nr:hypothetical protein [Burkholderia ubonensis]KVO15210.1 hypothetical protein WJ74_11200 [Burkholderia ubonensis]KVT01199.1 hypothetical protein WK47_25330 [Burkholderia ubonensis]KVT07370.1 hypothetical protein WK46_10580 [Burkholderia ubonensis]KVT33854.1 hypothetical protein WK50_02705 [Burkholderia ubonensis]
MFVSEFMTEIGLAETDIPSRVMWSMWAPSGTATARLDREGARVEFGVYETLGGESHVTSGVAWLQSGSDEILFHDGADEMFFEQFAETVRLMRLEQPE